MWLLNFNVVIVCLIHKILVLLKNHLNYLKDNIFECFFLKKELTYTAIKDTRNLFRQKKKTKAIKDRILRDIKNFFEHKKKITINQ